MLKNVISAGAVLIVAATVPASAQTHIGGAHLSAGAGHFRGALPGGAHGSAFMRNHQHPGGYQGRYYGGTYRGYGHHRHRYYVYGPYLGGGVVVSSFPWPYYFDYPSYDGSFLDQPPFFH
jgi:hypothetical protein